MSTATINVIMDRISMATKASPIVVFTVMGEHFEASLDAVFLTVQTKVRIKNRYSCFVGSFCASDNQSEVRAKLSEVLRNA